MSGVAIGAGARALEPDLLRFVAADQAALRGDASRMARPLRLVVPSSALRTHLGSALVRHAGRALLGVQIQTLASLAREILERAGVPLEREDLFATVVRRVARREPALRAALEDLADGYGAVRVGVDDLLDAGFEPAHAEVLDDALAARGVAADAPERALVRVAAGVAVALPDTPASHRSQLFARAREALERDAENALPRRAVAIYGFSDATGVQADLLVALVRCAGARVWLELPLDPSRAGVEPPETPFGASLRERLRAAAAAEERIPDAEPAHIEIWRARDPFDEARAVGAALRERLDAGAEPERLAVVARELAPYRLALRRSLTGFAIPFSGVGEPGPVSAAGRRLGALLELLRDGEALPAERWLEAVSCLPEGGARGLALSLQRRTDLAYALHARGRSALGDAVSLAPQGIRLTAPAELRADASGRIRAAYREVGPELVGALAASARALLRRLDAWPASAALEQHARRLSELVREALGWDAETPGSAELELALADAERGVRLERGEFFDWLARALSEQGRVPLGGAGAGVQLLSVMQARGLVFEHVFLLGLDRGIFPRPIREDPLLPDRARRRLRDVLPDLPVKREGFDEERFLFAQLLGASASLTLSFSAWDAEGRPLAPSPLLDLLQRGPRPVGVRAAPAATLATPRERACEAGLQASRGDFAAALEQALRAAQAGEGAGIGPDALARARVAVLAELDPHDGRQREAGPYLGFVGSVRACDPRAGPIAVTGLESLSRCPWQTFLERVLGLRLPRDARGALPEGSDVRLLGNVVHRALEEIAATAPAGVAVLEALRDADARPLPWPEEDALDAILLHAAHGVVRDEAIALDSYAHALARRARPFVLQARSADWQAGPPCVLGVEVRGGLALRDAQGGLREIAFKADRIDRHAGTLRLTDYKSGRPPRRDAASPQRQAEALREGIAQGRLLQAAVYAAAAGEGAVGRYLYLAPDLPDAVRELVAPGGSDAPERLTDVLQTLLAGWDAGAFVPRLREPGIDQEPQACRSCAVKDACLRGDSGVRLRLGAWAEAARAAPGECAALALWRLPEASA